MPTFRCNNASPDGGDSGDSEERDWFTPFLNVESDASKQILESMSLNVDSIATGPRLAEMVTGFSQDTMKKLLTAPAVNSVLEGFTLPCSITEMATSIGQDMVDNLRLGPLPSLAPGDLEMSTPILDMAASVTQEMTDSLRQAAASLIPKDLLSPTLLAGAVGQLDLVSRMIPLPEMIQLDAATIALSAVNESLSAPLLDLFRHSFPIFDKDWLRNFRDNTRSRLPSNLRLLYDDDYELFAVLAEVALEEGIPLTWVPRHEIVLELLHAASRADRLAIIEERRSDILDDCEAILSESSEEDAEVCNEAIVALRDGLPRAAQALAANLIDSIVLGFGGQSPRNQLTERAQVPYTELPFRGFAESLAIRPLYRTFCRWYPATGTPPPEHFSRHATAHAADTPAVYNQQNPMIAVMLATSLIRQYRRGSIEVEAPSVVSA